MQKSGTSDLPLHYGRVPSWLAERMAKLSAAIVEVILQDYGHKAFLSRLSDPLWFQSLGAVLGMDWHSSGITTSVMNALKKSINERSNDWGLSVCGGRGKQSRKTPDELKMLGDQKGLDADYLIKCSRLSAKVDNTAVQDGFQIYLHSFVVADSGDWVVVQQGMSDAKGQARRYHWHSDTVDSFVNQPHKAVCGINQGLILNLVHESADSTRKSILSLCGEHPTRIVQEARHIKMPAHHDVRIKDVNLKRLGAVLALAHELPMQDFESLLLLQGVGPRTLQSLTLVSEVIHGTPSRFEDPARFSFAHGGKDGHPFPVPLNVYDETIQILTHSVEKAKIGNSDKKKALASLHKVATRIESNFIPDDSKFEKYVEKERKESKKYGGRTVFDDKKSNLPKRNKNSQLSLFN